MVLGLRNNSATWLMRFRIKSSVMDAWYLVSLVNWLGFLEDFLVSSSLPQFQAKSSRDGRELKWLTLWQATAEYLEKPHVSIEPTMESSLIIELEEKLRCTSVSLAWWHGYGDYRGFWKQPPWRYCPRSCSIWPTEALAKDWS